jgi:hypothetical protein
MLLNHQIYFHCRSNQFNLRIGLFEPICLPADKIRVVRLISAACSMLHSSFTTDAFPHPIADILAEWWYPLWAFNFIHNSICEHRINALFTFSYNSAANSRLSLNDKASQLPSLLRNFLPVVKMTSSADRSPTLRINLARIKVNQQVYRVAN